MDAFVDTSIIIPAIIECPDTSLVHQFIQTTQYRLVISPLIYDEALFAGTKILLRERFDITSLAAVRKYVTNKGYEGISDFIERLNILVSEFSICPDSTRLQMISQIADQYHLLSGDALIIATCIDNNISVLASFDSDFKKVEGFTFLF